MSAIREMARHKEMSVPTIFTQHSYREFTKFGLVTSQVPTRQEIIAGYGPLSPEGYGCCYNPRPNQIDFMITSFIGNQSINFHSK